MQKRTTVGSLLPMMFNPSAFIENYLQNASFVFALLISGSAFGLFFLQTGLDLYRTGQKNLQFVYTIAGIGFLYGALVIPFFGVLIWSFFKIARSKSSFKQVLTAVCLSYSGLLFYSIFGIVFSLLLNWRTSIAFGVTGAVWSIGATIATIRKLSKNTALSIFLAIVFGSAVLFSWYYLGNI